MTQKYNDNGDGTYSVGTADAAVLSVLQTMASSTAPVTTTSTDGVVTGPIASTTVPGTTADGVVVQLDMQGFQSLIVSAIAPSASGMTFVVEGSDTGQVNDQWYLQVPVFVNNPSANSSGTISSSTTSANAYAYTRYHRYLRLRRLTTSPAGNISFTFQQSVARVPNQLNGIAPGGITNEGNTFNGTTTWLAGNTSVTRTANNPTLSGGIFTIPTATTGGANVVKPYSVPEADWQTTSTTVGLSTTTSTAIHAAAGATLRNYMTALQVSNTTATVTTIRVLDGATEIWARNLPANAEKEYTFPTPLRSSLNAALNIQLGTATNVIWSAQGYVAP